VTYKVVISGRANRQLGRIYDYIATKASSSAAERFVDDILDYCFGFDVFPERGMRRDDLSSGLRVIGFRRTVTITFFIGDGEVIISGIFYGGEDYEAMSAIGNP
jgi:toxin ParE1/3/4